MAESQSWRAPAVDLEAAVAQRGHSSDGRAPTVVVLQRDDQRPVSPSPAHGQLGPQPGRQQVLRVRRRLRPLPWPLVQPLGPEELLRVRLLRVRVELAQPAPPPAASRSSAPAAASKTATPAATPPRHRASASSRRRPLDQQIPVAVLEPGQRDPAALQHQVGRQPVRRRDQHSCGCARSTIVGVTPSSIVCDLHLPRLVDGGHADTASRTTASFARSIHRDPSGR